MLQSIKNIEKYWRYRDLVRNLVTSNLKVRYQGAMLGFPVVSGESLSNDSPLLFCVYACLP